MNNKSLIGSESIILKYFLASIPIVAAIYWNDVTKHIFHF